MTEKISSVYLIPAADFNKKLTEVIRKMPEFAMPEWALYVKTGTNKTKPPMDNDWWYARAASILRQIYLQKVVGVQRLRVKYGSRKNRGMKPEVFAKAGGKAIRTILQQSEKAGLTQKVLEGRRFGRKLTEKGKKLLEELK